MKKSIRKKVLLRIFAWCGVVYALFCAAVFVVQRSLLFYPTHDAPGGSLTAWSEDGQIVGYCREVPNPDAVWLMMHGNAGQASDRIYVLDHLSPSDALYVLEYPGYGARAGKPCRASFDAAALHAYNRLAERYPGKPLCVIGESIGSGPACCLAGAPRRPDKLVLIVPFDTMCHVASRRFPFLPVRLLLLDRWDNIDAIRSYRGPVDIYAARDDDVIPCNHARNLAGHCSRARYQELPGGHNDWSFSTVRIAR
ncbi:MAG: alpha/beta hydrolase [Thermoguttaceae bacterium]